MGGEDKELIKEGDDVDLDDLSEDDLKKLKQWCKDHPEDCKAAKKEGKEMMLIKEEEDEVEELVEFDKGDLKALCEEDPEKCEEMKKKMDKKMKGGKKKGPKDE